MHAVAAHTHVIHCIFHSNAQDARSRHCSVTCGATADISTIPNAPVANGARGLPLRNTALDPCVWVASALSRRNTLLEPLANHANGSRFAVQQTRTARAFDLLQTAAAVNLQQCMYTCKHITGKHKVVAALSKVQVAAPVIEPLFGTIGAPAPYNCGHECIDQVHDRFRH